MLRLPADYVTANVELAYAQTSHANQGRTVGFSLLFLDGPADSRGIYVPMTRGRHSNEVFVVLEGEQSALDVLGEALARDWIDEPAVARRAALAARAPSGHGREAATALSAAELRELLEQDHAISGMLGTAELRVDMYGDQLARATDRHQELSERLAETEAHRRQAQQVIDAFDHPLRRRLHRAELDQAQVALRQADYAINRMTTELAQIEGRLPALRSSLAEAQETLRERRALERERRGLRQRLAQDLDARSGMPVAVRVMISNMLGRSRRSGEDGFHPPIGVVRVVEEDVVSTPPELAARCDFPVFLPSYWPEECGEPVFALAVTMLGTDYIVRSAHDKPMLRVMGSPWRPDTNWAEDDFRPVEGMPWPTLMRRTRPATVVVVKTPHTRVHLFTSLGRDETFEVARSLELLPPGT